MRKKPVLQLDSETGEVINEYAHMAEANLSMGVCPRQNDIRMVCQSKKPSDFGFGWKFKEDYQKKLRKRENIFQPMIFKGLFCAISILNRMEKVAIYLTAYIQ